VLDPGSDGLGRLASALDRPRASLAAFSSLSEDQLAVLVDAIEATVVRRSDEVDAALARAFPEVAAPLVSAALRSQGRTRLRRLIGREA
jgi:hypothetical protein